MQQSNHNRESGKALVELALLVPLLFTIMMGTLEALRYIRYNQMLSVVSRDAARGAFICAYNSAPTVPVCVQTNVEQAFPPQITGIMANVGMIVSVWDFNALGPVLVSQLVRPMNESSPTPTPVVSKFAAARVQGLASYNAIKQRIVIAEAFYQDQRLVPQFSGQYWSVTIM